MIGFRRKRSFLIGTLYYLGISLSIIFLASPLFRILGFEYSGVVALCASIHLLFYAANEAIPLKSESVWSVIKQLWIPTFLLSSIPLFVSLISALFIPNCSLWDGILFYIEI